MKEIKCNKCGTLFRIAKIRIQKRALDPDEHLIQSYFKCPECGEINTILLTDPVARELIKAGKRAEARERSFMLRLKYWDYSLGR